MEKRFVIFFFLLNLYGCTNAYKFCKVNGDCSSMKGSSCLHSFCACQDGAIPNADWTKCLTVAMGPDFKCEDDAQCSAWINGPNECYDGKCRCLDGYRYDKTQCVKAKYVGDGCGADADCVSGILGPAQANLGMVCRQGRCGCNEGYYERDVDCRLKSEEGKDCAIELDCPKGLVCENVTPARKVCKTKTNPPPEQPETLEISEDSERIVSKTCTNDGDCSAIKGPAFCAVVFKRCLCEPGYVFDKKAESCLVDLGEKCGANVQEACTKTSNCLDGTCQCPLYWINSYLNEKCLKPVDKFGTSACASDRSCVAAFGRNVECRQGSSSKVCQCRVGFKYNADTAYCEKDSSEASASCNEQDPTCSKAHTICDLKIGFCVCDKNYHNKNGACVSGLGGECVDDDNCDGSNMECPEKKCACKKNFVPYEDTECLKVVSNMAESCATDLQCKQILGTVGICKDKKCHCPPDYKLDEKGGKHSCLKMRYFEDYCHTSVDCKVVLKSSSVQCRNNHCVCDYGYKMNKDTMECDSNSTRAILGSALLVAFSALVASF